MIAGLFDDARSAQRALQALTRRHYDASDLSVRLVEDGAQREIPILRETGVGQGAALGTTIGSVAGALLASTGLLGVPGPVPGVDLLWASIEGAVAGAILGMTFGGAASLGRWRVVADFHGRPHVQRAIWVRAEADGRDDDAEALLRRTGALYVTRSSPIARLLGPPEARALIRPLLGEDHRRLEALLDEVMGATGRALGPRASGILWAWFERCALAHFAFEEQTLFPELAPRCGREIGELCAEHDQIRNQLREALSHGVPPPLSPSVLAVATSLRAHSDREDRTVYRWSDREPGAARAPPPSAATALASSGSRIARTPSSVGRQRRSEVRTHGAKVEPSGGNCPASHTSHAPNATPTRNVASRGSCSAARRSRYPARARPTGTSGRRSTRSPSRRGAHASARLPRTTIAPTRSA